MLETHFTAAAAAPLDPVWWADASVRHVGPDRRRQPARGLQEALGAVLDELDYGVVLLAPEGEVVYRNHAAALELQAGQLFQFVGRRLTARGPADALPFEEALRNAAHKGLRKLVFLGGGDEPAGVAVVPLRVRPIANGPASTEAVSTLLVLGKRHVCESLSVQGLAGRCQLTHAEARVLGALCSGLSPARVAEDIGVAISTVRTHIGTIRIKTGAESIRALVARVARLPPLMGALRPLLRRVP